MSATPSLPQTEPEADTSVVKGVGWWLVVIGISVLAGVGIREWRYATAPKPPVLNTQGLDQVVMAVLERLQSEVRAQPRSGDAWGRLGMALIGYEFAAEARICFAHAARFSPKNPRWPYFHGLLLFPDEAERGIQMLEHTVELNADRPDIPRVRLAQILLERGQWSEAEKHFRRLMELRPEHPPAWLGLGRVAFENNRLTECADWLEKASRSPYTAQNAGVLLASLKRRMNDIAGAAAVIARAQELPPDEGWPDPYTEEASEFHVGRKAWLDQSTKLFRRGKLSEALHFTMLAIKAYPEAPDAWLVLGRVRMARKEYPLAESALRKNIELDLQSVEGHSQLGVALMYQSKTAEAVERFRKAIELKPDLSEGYFNLGLCFSALEQRSEAIESFRNAIRYKSGLVEAYLGLAEQLDRVGRSQEALEQLHRAQQLKPNDPRIPALLERLRKGGGTPP